MSVSASQLYEVGVTICADALTLPRARAFLHAIDRYPCARLVRIVRDGEAEGVEIEFETELPTEPAVALERSERVQLRVEADESQPPEAWVLRRDFPATPHQLLSPSNTPRRLCLFEEPWAELRSSVTPDDVLQLVSDWFERAGAGKLHLPGQRLEPFVPSAGRLIVDREPPSDTPAPYAIAALSIEPLVLRASPARPDGDSVGDLVLPIRGSPTDGIVIRHLPVNFGDLRQLLREARIDLVDEVRRATSWVVDHREKRRLLDREWLFHIELPKLRDGEEVDSEHVAFALKGVTIRQLGLKTGALVSIDGDVHYGPVPISRNVDLQVGVVGPLDPVLFPSHETARRWSGLPRQTAPRELLSLGAGALGSQITLNLARLGIGRWTIIDVDHLLPHNLTRHGLSCGYVGHSKAEALAHEVSWLLGPGAAEGLRADIHSDETTCHEEFTAALDRSEAILDFSASQSALRRVSRLPSTAPRASAYLGVSGRSIVLLGEGGQRAVRLDDLDAQLLAAIPDSPELEGLIVPEGELETVRCGGSCGDETAVIPQDAVATFGGIAARAIRDWIESPRRIASVWQLDDDTLGVRRRAVDISPVRTFTRREWEIRVSESVISAIHRRRLEALPSETGGIITGSLDLWRRTIYVTRASAAPADSRLSPSEFTRGRAGLRAHLDQVRRKTAGAVGYVGEWHSHPTSCSAQPSSTDCAALDELAGAQGRVGRPALVLIAGDDGDLEIILRNLE